MLWDYGNFFFCMTAIGENIPAEMGKAQMWSLLHHRVYQESSLCSPFSSDCMFCPFSKNMDEVRDSSELSSSGKPQNSANPLIHSDSS